MKHTDKDGRKWETKPRTWITLDVDATDTIVTITTCIATHADGFPELAKEDTIVQRVEPAQAAQIEAALAFQPKLAVDKLTRKELVTPEPIKDIKE